MSNKYLKDAIVDYINNNSDKKLNSLDICSYFKIVEQTYIALDELEKERRIIRHNGPLGGWNGNHYYETGAHYEYS